MTADITPDVYRAMAAYVDALDRAARARAIGFGDNPSDWVIVLDVDAHTVTAQVNDALAAIQSPYRVRGHRLSPGTVAHNGLVITLA